MASKTHTCPSATRNVSANADSSIALRRFSVTSEQRQDGKDWATRKGPSAAADGCFRRLRPTAAADGDRPVACDYYERMTRAYTLRM